MRTTSHTPLSKLLKKPHCVFKESTPANGMERWTRLLTLHRGDMPNIHVTSTTTEGWSNPPLLSTEYSEPNRTIQKSYKSVGEMLSALLQGRQYLLTEVRNSAGNGVRRNNVARIGPITTASRKREDTALLYSRLANPAPDKGGQIFLTMTSVDPTAPENEHRLMIMHAYLDM